MKLQSLEEIRKEFIDMFCYEDVQESDDGMDSAVAYIFKNERDGVGVYNWIETKLQQVAGEARKDERNKCFAEFTAKAIAVGLSEDYIDDYFNHEEPKEERE